MLVFATFAVIVLELASIFACPLYLGGLRSSLKTSFKARVNRALNRKARKKEERRKIETRLEKREGGRRKSKGREKQWTGMGVSRGGVQ